MFDIIAFTSITFAGLVSIIHAIQSSKCDTIDFCCVKCHRVVKNGNDQEEEQQPLEQIVPEISPRIIERNLNNF